MQRTALVVGGSGIGGSSVARELIANGWITHGLARQPKHDVAGCKESGRPFQFPGSAAQWNGLSDVTEARMLAKQLVWAADTDAARNEAFNIVNGDLFRWSRLWGQLAEWFGVPAVGFTGSVQPLEAIMANDQALWRDMAERHGLAEPSLDRLASAWHTDLDLGRPLEVMTDMARSRKLGFAVYQATDESFFDLFAQLRAERLIP